MYSYLLFTLLALGTYSFYMLGKGRAVAAVGGSLKSLHSRPVYHGAYSSLLFLVPALLTICLWLMIEPVVIRTLTLQSIEPELAGKTPAQVAILYSEIANIARGILAPESSNEFLTPAIERYQSLQSTASLLFVLLVLGCACLGGALAFRKISAKFRARPAVENLIQAFLFGSSTVAVLTTIGIVASLLVESLRFFQIVPLHEFLFGTRWSPQIAIRADQVASSGAFGAIPLFTGTFLIAAIAMAVASPVGLFAAMYLAEYATPRVRSVAKPLLEVLAGIPTVVYGFFAAITVAPTLKGWGSALGISVSSESALAAGVVMGIMIIPYVSSLSDDVINAVPQSLRDGSFALGATKSETISKVVFPAALPGIVGALLLAVSRAIGETMIVVMAAGLIAKLTINPLDNVTTVTVQIVTNLVGDQEFDDPKTLSAFALGLVLFCITLVLNIIALQVVKKYREKYD